MWLKKFLSFVNGFRIKPLVFEIRKLELEYGDFLLIKFPENTDDMTLRYAEETIHRMIPNTRVVFYNQNIEFSVVKNLFKWKDNEQD